MPKLDKKPRSTLKCCILPGRHHGERAPSSFFSPSSFSSARRLLSPLLSPTHLFQFVMLYFSLKRARVWPPHIGRENCACTVMKHSRGTVMVHTNTGCCVAIARAGPGRSHCWKRPGGGEMSHLIRVPSIFFHSSKWPRFSAEAH